MTKQEQIEEMGKVMPEKIKDPLDNSRYIIFGKSLRREIARIYYNAGYRKVSADTLILTENQLKKIIEEEYKEALEGKVVLSREEYDTLKAENDKYVKDCIDYIATINKLENKVWEVEQQASKETAEKILFKFESAFAYYDNEDMFSKKAIFECLEEIVKSIGVEIKE